MARETETIGPPWELELIREDGKLVEVRIKATGDNELGFDSVREATNTVITRLRGERGPGPLVRPRRSRFMLQQIYEAGGGKLTPEYLAQLAVTYADITEAGGAVVPMLASAIDKPPATVKGHVMKAREEGYLTPTTPGKEGGTPTDKARKVLADYSQA